MHIKNGSDCASISVRIYIRCYMKLTCLYKMFRTWLTTFWNIVFFLLCSHWLKTSFILKTSNQLETTAQGANASIIKSPQPLTPTLPSGDMTACTPRSRYACCMHCTYKAHSESKTLPYIIATLVSSLASQGRKYGRGWGEADVSVRTGFSQFTANNSAFMRASKWPNIRQEFVRYVFGRDVKPAHCSRWGFGECLFTRLGVLSLQRVRALGRQIPVKTPGRLEAKSAECQGLFYDKCVSHNYFWKSKPCGESSPS